MLQYLMTVPEKVWILVGCSGVTLLLLGYLALVGYAIMTVPNEK